MKLTEHQKFQLADAAIKQGFEDDELVIDILDQYSSPLEGKLDVNFKAPLPERSGCLSKVLEPRSKFPRIKGGYLRFSHRRYDQYFLIFYVSTIKQYGNVYKTLNFIQRPSKNKIEEEGEVSFNYDMPWSDLLSITSRWYNLLKLEVNAKQFLRFSSMFRSSSQKSVNSLYNESFTHEEKARVKKGIRQLKGRIDAEMGLDKEDLQIINEKLDDLLKKVDELNKFDFRSSFAGLIINLISSALYDKRDSFINILGSLFPNLLN